MRRDGSLQRFGLPDHYSFAAPAYIVPAKGSKFTLSKVKPLKPRKPGKPANTESCRSKLFNAEEKRGFEKKRRQAVEVYRVDLSGGSRKAVYSIH